MGATHGAELPVLFGLAKRFASLAPRELEVLAGLQAAWTAFATTPASALSSPMFRWPRYKEYKDPRKTLVRLAFDQEKRPSIDYNTKYDYWCDVLGALDKRGMSMPHGMKRVVRELRERGPEGSQADVVKRIVERMVSDKLIMREIGGWWEAVKKRELEVGAGM